MITFEAPVMTMTAAAEYAAIVMGLRPWWTHIQGEQFFTLGRPAYQTREKFSEYVEEAHSANTLLWKHFATLFLAVFDKLEQHLCAPVFHMPGLALPGFHIFEYHAGQHAAHGSAHFDLSHQQLSQHFGFSCDPGEHLSYTVAIELPPQGSGIDIFPVTYDEMQTETVEDFVRSHPCSYIPYAPRFLYLFSGDRLHRISHGRSPMSGRRITLQGHLFKSDGAWITYW